MPEGVNVGTAYLEIVPSARGFVAKMNAEVGGDMAKGGDEAGKQYGKRFGLSAKSIIGSIIGGAIGAGAISFLKGANEEAREAQKVGALTNAVLKSTGGVAKISAKQVGDLAGAISKKSGIDDEAIQSGANLLLTFKNIRNETGKGNDIFNQATQSMVDMAAGMAAVSGGSIDFRSASTMLGKALNDPIKGLAAMGRVGVQFSKSQQKAIKKMVESGNTMGAQKAILKELNAQFGGAAASQATAADKAQVAWGDLKEEIGTKLLPVADKFATWATDDLIPALSDAADWIDRNKVAVATLAGVIATGVAAAKTYAITTGLIAAFQARQAVAAGTATVAQTALNTAMRANVIGLIVTAIAGLAAGLVYAYKKSETFRNIVNGVWSAVKTGASKMWSALKSTFRFIVDKWLWAAGMLVKGAAKAFGWVPHLGDKLKAAAKNFDDFRDDVNAKLRGIKDKKIKVSIDDRTGPKLRQIQSAVLGLKGKDIPVTVNDKPASSLSGLLTPNRKRRANGGSIRAGDDYIVGERGPELFTSSVSGRIIPNHELTSTARGLGGGGPVNVQVFIGDEEFEGRVTAIALDAVGA